MPPFKIPRVKSVNARSSDQDVFHKIIAEFCKTHATSILNKDFLFLLLLTYGLQRE